MPSSLRADAPEFVPSSWQAPSAMMGAFSGAEEQADDEFSEVSITEEDLFELEDVERWVEALVDLDLAREEHLIAMAMAEAPEAILVVEERAAAKNRQATGAANAGAH